MKSTEVLHQNETCRNTITPQNTSSLYHTLKSSCKARFGTSSVTYSHRDEETREKVPNWIESRWHHCCQLLWWCESNSHHAVETEVCECQEHEQQIPEKLSCNHTHHNNVFAYKPPYISGKCDNQLGKFPNCHAWILWHCFLRKIELRSAMYEHNKVGMIWHMRKCS